MSPSVIISIIIPIRNRWENLNDTLISLEMQSSKAFEVIIVDDGSTTTHPSFLENAASGFDLKIIRQPPLGVSTARNTGVNESTKPLLLFIDSDCELDPNCIENLIRSSEKNKKKTAFQLCFKTATQKFVWRIDGISKCSKQETLLTNYIDTAGFAIRRNYVEKNGRLFDSSHIRGEDTDLLRRLIIGNETPMLVQEALVTHKPIHSFIFYLIKHTEGGFRSSPARVELLRTTDIILSKTGKIEVLKNIHKKSSKFNFGYIHLLAIMLCYSAELFGRVLFRLVGMTDKRTTVLGAPLSCINSPKLLETLTNSALSDKPLCATYLTAWSLVQSKQIPNFRKDLHEFDIVYADGMGVCLAAFFQNLSRVEKVTANDFFNTLCAVIETRKLKLAIIGGSQKTLEKTTQQLQSSFPQINIALSSSGYFSEIEELNIINKIVEVKPDIIVLAMGQPLQESTALKIKANYKRTTILCVGGLFDYIAGRNPTPISAIRNFGFEWLWRLGNSPRRLWKRYVIGLPLLMVYLANYHFSKNLKKGVSLPPQD